MIILTGNSLGERQKDLNDKINKASADNYFDKYKTEVGNNDVDKIFMIDLAAKHKNVEFILEIFKSGDVVHITRALNKCQWLNSDDLADIINVDNMHNNMFPLMSIKMKNKFLSMLSVAVKTESRAVAFHKYCMKERLFKIAMKFLYNTPESFKLDVILQKGKAFNEILRNQEALPNFIKNSFNLAQTFLDNIEAGNYRNDMLDILRYMYSISNEQYLDMLEKYVATEYWYSRFGGRRRLGSRISKEIIKKHKSRVIQNPMLYVNLLNKQKIAKNCTINDAKVYARPLLPDEVFTFWNFNYYEKYRFVLDIIPAGERFPFIKTIFTEKYPNEKFEMSEEFYKFIFYDMMAAEDKESWALRHIANGEEILGSGNDYNWYKFVSFDKAFEAIKKYILITPDSDKRMEILNVLVDSAKTQNDLEKLLNYYYDRHVNEATHHKISFIDCLLEKHNVFNIEEKCWKALEKIFCSLDVYLNTSKYMGDNYRAIALIYYIINDKTVPKTLSEFVNNNTVNVSNIKKSSKKLETEKRDKVYKYFHDFYLTAVVESLASNYEMRSVFRYISNYLDLLHSFSKTKDDIAEIINNVIKENWDHFKDCSLLSTKAFSERNIIQYMKTDATLVVSEFPRIKQYIQDRFGRTNWLYRKLKIYFQHDIAKRYLQLLDDCLSADDVNYRMVEVAVYGILILAEEPFKVEFMKKHVPTNPKIDHANIPRGLLNIQQAICGYLCVSRPPLPKQYVLQYLTGDYVQNCLPMFNFYLMNLPLPDCISFVESIIDTPVSIQKHGLRLAFQCFSTENLKRLINDIWKRTKNISMRKILYKSLFDKVLKETDQTQLELFEVLNTLTLDLHQDDDNELFSLLVGNNMPKHIKGQYIASGWLCVEKLPARSVNYDRMTKVIYTIENNLNLVPEFVTIAIVDNHVCKMLDEEGIFEDDLKKGLEELYRTKWELTLRYLTNVYNEKQLENNLEVVKRIIKMCLGMRNKVHKKKYIMREFITNFIKDLESKSYDCHEIESYSNMKILIDAILKVIQETLPEYEIFALILEMRLSYIARNVIISHKKEFDETGYIEIRTCFNEFAKQFVILLKECINDRKYFAFHTHIDDGVTEQLYRVNTKLNGMYKEKPSPDELSIIMCISLLKYDIKEVYLLILRLLPINYSGDLVSEYNETVSAVKAFKNTEVQYFMFEKFVNTDYMVRKQMLTHIE